MITCSNCSNEAVYRYKITGTYSMLFCAMCLPSFLKTKKYSGRVVLMSKETPVVEEAPAPKKRTTRKKKETAPVVEEPIEEEPIVEDTTEEVVDEDGTD